ncbi:hypothetical protein LTR10_016333 [Elasticomyces elasticus]|uniref:BTB domain-containing protein n=1 Tax=Exophiala sideris TaxID=1016849 RepID=A0ABR0J5G5_9EURO|nr:hypothetical protein LTR10_016333 [Elasticomyces elasticus]KAK5028343.1 hypothetical protein LTS07_006434 [Exophiala sideris]KAK5036014.1 hypothetical protein LTR13_005584 [Exophiala sideris]KAK5057050.1 hypothetical protein LTR69_007688 [Exophiala sideris]KAK5181457.1 hypothetical protein LTR44_006252 [Eurotiomycetes sp. CCFEE 6388]
MVLGTIAYMEPPQVDYGTEVTTIIVGTERKEFTIHSELLFAAVPVFQDYIEKGSSHRLPSRVSGVQVEGGDWASSDPCKKLVLPNEDPLLFSLFRDWIYSGRIPDHISRYMKAMHESYADLFWWRVFKLGERLQTGGLVGLAVGELKKLFSAEKPNIPSQHFIECLFDEPSSKLHCMRQYIVRHAAFWLEKSANREVWLQLLNSHEKVAPVLASALIKKHISHPQQESSEEACPDHCYHGLIYEYVADTAYTGIEDSCYLPEGHTFHLTRAQLNTVVPTEPGQYEADLDSDDGWGFERPYQPSRYCCDSRADGWDCSCTTVPVVPTPSQSTIPGPPTETPPPCPSQQAQPPILTFPEHGQDVNTQQPQDMLKEFEGSNYAGLVAKFGAWLLTEASGQSGTKSHDNLQTASTFKNGENIGLNNGSMSHGGLDTPSYRYCPDYGFCVVDPEAPNGCTGCGHGPHHADNLALADGLVPRQPSVTNLGDWTNTGGNRKVPRTGGDGW